MKSYHQQSGFSLVETLVAVTILMLVMMGPMTISSQTAKSSSFASEQVTAFFLAQEGVELMQKARDDLLVKNFAGDIASPWATFSAPGGMFTTCFTSGCGLEIQNYNSSQSDLRSPVSCATIANCRLYRTDNSQRSRFTHTASGNTQTLFTRVIRLETVNANEVRVRSIVTWRTGSLRDNQTVEVEARLLNIYGN